MTTNFTRREFMTNSMLGLSAIAMPKSFNFIEKEFGVFMNKENKSKVDFSYAFATPHRICIALPEASKKCLVDSAKSGVAVSWSDDDLTSVPLGAFYGPKLKWFINISAEVNGKIIDGVSWKRVDNRLPALEFKWKNSDAEIVMTAASAEKHDVFKFTVKNIGTQPNEIGVFGKTKDLSFNTKWIDPNSDYNASLAHYGDRSDRMLFFSTEKAEKLKSPSNVDVILKLNPNEEKVFYFIRPQKALIDDLPNLLKHDWDGELNKALDVWRKLLEKTMKIHIPDKMVEDAYYACFGDIFIARELNSAGEMSGLAGTNLYRCMNTCEPAIAATVLDHSGMYKESEAVMKGILDLQDPVTGRWDDYRTWGHDIGWIPGPRSRWIKEHYLFTRDIKFLLDGFERMYKHVKWAYKERQKTKVLNADGSKPLTWGLLPRGMGDGGLMDGDDYYGYFIPSNVWYCYIAKLAFWAAGELNLNDKQEEIKKYLDDASHCTLDAIKRGAIVESDGTKWIPGVPGKTSGSRFAATNSIHPCELIAPFDELANGTLKKLESSISEGGIPKDLGWLKGGLWVSMALDNLAYAHIEREEFDEASAYLYPTLNHGTPLYTWCEERLPEPGSAKITGDIQHTWTPHIVNRFIRDALVMEKGDILSIASVTDRDWLKEGLSLGVENANTQFGMLSYNISRETAKRIKIDFNLESRIKPDKIAIHIRIPEKDKKIKLKSITNNAMSKLTGNKIEIEGKFNRFNAIIEIV